MNKSGDFGALPGSCLLLSIRVSQLINHFLGRQGQELSELVAAGDALEERGRCFIFASVILCFAQVLADVAELLRQHLAEQFLPGGETVLPRIWST